jgi:asparagine synthase (glutamine-hydrolysing)
VRRRKQAFGVPLDQWLRGPLRDLVGDALSRASVARRALLDPDAVSALVDEHQSGRGRKSRLLWSLLCLELWCREILDAPAVAHN